MQALHSPQREQGWQRPVSGAGFAVQIARPGQVSGNRCFPLTPTRQRDAAARVHPMTRTLRVLMRRDSSRDRQDGQTYLEGYAILWPDGRPLGVGFDAFCTQGQRLFGLGRRLRGCRERLVDMIYFPWPDLRMT